jgi:arginyl-tRNA synthetase
VGYNVVKGFLNLSLSDAFYLKQFQTLFQQEDYGHQPQKKDAPTLMVEFSSPNTNKPLHLGHIRNNILGYSVSKILEANGNRVVKTQIINDRGIHICKSMLAWKKFGAGKTPELTGSKGDQLVGKYYVIFDAEYKKEIAELISKDLQKNKPNKKPHFYWKHKSFYDYGKQAIKRFETCGKL